MDVDQNGGDGLTPEELEMNNQVEARLAELGGGNASFRASSEAEARLVELTNETLETQKMMDEVPESETVVVSGGESDGDEADTEGGEDQQVSGLARMKEMLARSAMARPAFDSDVVHSATANLPMNFGSPMTLPWEMGFLGMVMGGAPDARIGPSLKKSVEEKLNLVDIEFSDDVEMEEMPELDKRPKISQSARKPMAIEDEQDRDNEMQKWVVITNAIGEENEVVELIAKTNGAALADVLAKKKTGTLRVRSSSILLYVRWAKAKGLAPFPISTEVVYKYVDELRKDKAPATRANSFRSALAFLKGTFKLDHVDEVLDNSAISGSCHRSFLTKRLLRQRDALTVDQVQILESVVDTAQSLSDRVFAGHCLLCVYGRLRFGDSQGIEAEPYIDGEYLEAGTSMHKTDSLFGRARRLLPVAAPAVGVSKTNWAVAFLQARKDAGLRAGAGRPLMPAPITGGGWSPGKLRTSEASVWLCEILQRYSLGPQNVSNIGAHSLKATALSWMAKAGLPEKTRRFLGYHVKPKDKSLIIYSRDSMAGPLEMLDNLVVQIAMGEFKPDMSRSGRWVRKPKDKVDRDQRESDSDECLDVMTPSWDTATSKTHNSSVERIVEYDNMTSDSSESGGEESSGGEIELYRHGLTGAIHKGSKTEGLLACGRKITAVMTKLDGEVHGVGSMCKICTGYSR